MNPIAYYTITTALFIAEVICAIKIKDISTVFGFIGTIAGTSLSFFLPSALFIRAVIKYGDSDAKRDNKGLWIMSWVNLVIGTGLFGLFLYANILSLT
jgi:hypothetical protein